MPIRFTGVIAAAVLALSLTACGEEEKPADVASLATGAPAAASAAPVSQERPLLRPDASAEEEDRLFATWQKCLEENGGTPKRQAAGDGPVGVAVPDPAADAAEAAAMEKCAHMEPEAPWERSQRLDPDYADKLRDWVTCIRSHGIDAWEADGFLTFESLPPDPQMAKVDECQMKAFNVA